MPASARERWPGRRRDVTALSTAVTSWTDDDDDDDDGWEDMSDVSDDDDGDDVGASESRKPMPAAPRHRGGTKSADPRHDFFADL